VQERPKRETASRKQEEASKQIKIEQIRGLTFFNVVRIETAIAWY